MEVLVLASKDDELVTIDKVSLELINEVKPRVFEKINRVDPSKQVRYAQEIGLAGPYKLVRL